MMDAVRTSEMSVDNHFYGSISKKTTLNNRQFVYISIDATYNRFPYMEVLVRITVIMIFNANVNMSLVLLW
jgi:hypothetical protein